MGRSGTYIALDYLIQQAKSEGMVDPFQCVKEMRARRPAMIQTEVKLRTVFVIKLSSTCLKQFQYCRRLYSQIIDFVQVQYIFAKSKFLHKCKNSRVWLIM